MEKLGWRPKIDSLYLRGDIGALMPFQSYTTANIYGIGPCHFFLGKHSMMMAGATLSSWRHQRIYVFSNSQIIHHQKVLALEPIFIGSLHGIHSLTSIQAILVFALAS